jgi:hypothetical protein
VGYALDQSGRFAEHQAEAEVNIVWLANGAFLKTPPNAPQTDNLAYLSNSMTATF